jgi:hypothetical protein
MGLDSMARKFRPDNMRLYCAVYLRLQSLTELLYGLSFSVVIAKIANAG